MEGNAFQWNVSDLDQLLSVMQGRLYLEKFFSDFLIVSLKNQHTGILKKLLMTVGKLSLSKLFTKKKEVIPQVLFCKKVTSTFQAIVQICFFIVQNIL